jgi:predicted nucleotidyltransferase component of viral defense system
MEDVIYTHLQLRELFHIEFLRSLSRKLKLDRYAVKGGVNLRLFFKSTRYSEDMDLDISGITVGELKGLVMKILQAQLFRESFYAFGIKEIIPPDMRVAKQTQTTQRFKVHLITLSGEDLFTKIEFSRRGFTGNVIAESVSAAILRDYKLPPLITVHYDVGSAMAQKINALSLRAAIQARDIFDLYVLLSQVDSNTFKGLKTMPCRAVLSRAYERIFEVNFEMFKDTVVSYLSDEDQNIYANVSSWEEIKLKTANFIEGLNREK